MRVARDDDESKYAKASSVQARSAALTAALLVGLCLGIIASERLYLASQEAEVDPAALAAVRSRKLEVGGGAAVAAGGGDAGLRRTGGKPRNELEALLREVAPGGEVMIAISNMNLIHEQTLVMWLEVRSCCLGWKACTRCTGRGDLVLPAANAAAALCQCPAPPNHIHPRAWAPPHPAPPHLFPPAVRAAHPGPDQLAGGGHRRAAARLPQGARHRALLPPRGHPRLAEGHGAGGRAGGHGWAG